MPLASWDVRIIPVATEGNNNPASCQYSVCPAGDGADASLQQDSALHRSKLTKFAVFTFIIENTRNREQKSQ